MYASIQKLYSLKYKFNLKNVITLLTLSLYSRFLTLSASYSSFDSELLLFYFFLFLMSTSSSHFGDDHFLSSSRKIRKPHHRDTGTSLLVLHSRSCYDRDRTWQCSQRMERLLFDVDAPRESGKSLRGPTFSEQVAAAAAETVSLTFVPFMWQL